MAEAPALASHVGDGLWNPASVLLPVGDRARVSVATLNAPQDQGVSAQTLTLAVALPAGTSGAFSAVRASVADLVRTSTDPQTVGGEIPYSTMVLSLTAARRSQAHFVTGVALRYRTGQIDAVRRGALGIDGGVVADGLSSRDLRVGLSSFLWRPGAASRERTSLELAGDGRIAGTGPRLEARAGYAFSSTEAHAREHYVFTSARSGNWEGRAGLARSFAFGETSSRIRLGLDLHYARYTVGIAREDTGAGLAPTYQFALITAVR